MHGDGASFGKHRSFLSMKLYMIPGIIAIFSLVIIWASLQLDVSPAMIVGHSMQPRVFPIFLMVINLLLAGLLAFQYRKTPPNELPPESFRTWCTIALFVLFYPTTVYLDMMIAIAVVMFAMCLLWGERRLHIAAFVALATPTAIFFLFDLALQVRFPRGLLTNWYYG